MQPSETHPRGHFELLSSSNAAYLTNAFLIRVPPGLDLLDQHGQISMKLLDRVRAPDFAVLVHECVHLRHNFSTLAGFVQFVAVRELTAAMSRTKDPLRWVSVGNAGRPNDERERTRANLDFLRRLVGDMHVEAAPADTKLVVTAITRPAPDSPLFEPLVVRLAFERDGRVQHECSASLGFAAIEESLAWFVERTTAATLLARRPPLPPPAYPYTTLDAVGQYLAPSVKPELVAKVALLALNTAQPWAHAASWLIELQAASDRETALAEIVERWRVEYNVRGRATLERVTAELLESFKGRGLAERGVQKAAKLAARLIAHSFREPFLEVEFATGGRGWPEFFHQGPSCELLLGHERADEFGLMESIRTMPGIDEEEDDIPARRVLHAQEHFVRLHLVQDGLRSTASVEADVAPARRRCPYFESCDLPMRFDDAAKCEERPWATYRDDTYLCWYGYGVAALFGEIASSKSIEVPRARTRTERETAANRVDE